MELTISIIVWTVVAMLAHELGHLTAARFYGVTVKELALGLGPRLCGFSVRGVKFNLRAAPLGSFVRLDGLELREQTVWGQLCVHMGGMAVNAVLGLVFFGTLFGWLNLLIAAGNLLPLYQQDGWKCGVVLMRALVGRPSRPVEWTFTFCGGFISLFLVYTILSIV